MSHYFTLWTRGYGENVLSCAQYSHRISRDALTSGQASLEDALDFVTLASRLSTLQDQARSPLEIMLN